MVGKRSIRYTVMEAEGYDSYTEAGEFISLYEQKLGEKGVNNYLLTWTNKGIIVQVREGNRVLGYLG